MQGAPAYPERLLSDAARAARRIRAARTALILSHIDADGIAAASVAKSACDRLGVRSEVSFAKKMDDGAVAAVNGSGADAVWICDLGSGCLSRFARDGVVVTDHHVPDPGWRRGRTSLDSFVDVTHLNPHAYGLDGATDVSGAGMAYILAKTLDPANADLAALAVVGACGDMQEGADGFTGLNRLILADAVETGGVEVVEDVRLFGRETRPLVQFLEYGLESPGCRLSGNSVECCRFYEELGIPLKDGGAWRTWSDLSEDERGRAAGRLLSLAPPEEAAALYGGVCLLPGFAGRRGLGNVKEMSTLLNSCGRYDDAPTGMRICMGDASAAEDAERHRAEHRQNISAALAYVRRGGLVKARRYIQYFDAGRAVKETVVGIVAGMVLGSEGCSRDLPIVAFADADDGVKVSARADRSLASRGLDLSAVMAQAAKQVGGYGGGHSVAAGATIPPGKKKEFLDAVEDMVSAQVI